MAEVLAALVCLLVVPAVAAAAKRPPELPSCFSTGSGFGACQGDVIPGGGSVTKLTTPNDEDWFRLIGPAPLQSKEPVACGDAGCVYNHLSWYIGGGAARRHDCGENQSRCVVSIEPGSTQWAEVYVREDNDPKLLWALWEKPRGQDVVLRGTVREHDCTDFHAPKCVLEIKPARVPVVLDGRNGRKQTLTHDDGTFAFSVPKGHYTLTVPHVGPTKPSSRSVDARTDVQGLDFSLCKLPQVVGPVPPARAGVTFACQIVEIDGWAIDISGAPYDNVNVSTGDDSTTTDSEGYYELFTHAGPAQIIATDHIATSSINVIASDPITNAPDLTVEPKLDFLQTPASGVYGLVWGLPLGSGTSDIFSIQPVGTPSAGQCVSQQTSPLKTIVGRHADISTLPMKYSSFCPGQYTGTVLSSSGATVASAPFTIP